MPQDGNPVPRYFIDHSGNEQTDRPKLAALSGEIARSILLSRKFAVYHGSSNWRVSCTKLIYLAFLPS
jgi:hypothetical protein